LQPLQFRGQAASVVIQTDDVAHDFIGAFLPERNAETIRGAGKIEADDRDVVGKQSRTELHRFTGADDAVGSGYDHRTAFARRAEDLIDQIFRRGGEAAIAKDVKDAAQSECLCRWLS